jgi:hypothetical protein
VRTHRSEVVADPLRLIVERHVRHIVHAIQRAWRVCLQWSEQGVETFRRETRRRNQFKRLSDCER